MGLDYRYRPGGGETLLRLDSLVIWLPPRLSASLVTTQDRYGELTVAWMGRTWTGNLHSSPKLCHLSAVVDGLPTEAPPGTVNCRLGRPAPFASESARQPRRTSRCTTTPAVHGSWSLRVLSVPYCKRVASRTTRFTCSDRPRPRSILVRARAALPRLERPAGQRSSWLAGSIGCRANCSR